MNHIGATSAVCAAPACRRPAAGGGLHPAFCGRDCVMDACDLQGTGAPVLADGHLVDAYRLLAHLSQCFRELSSRSPREPLTLLDDVLETAQGLRDLAAALVMLARAQKSTWPEIGAACRENGDTARYRWPEDATRRKLARRFARVPSLPVPQAPTQPQAPGAEEGEEGDREAVELLGQALEHLRTRSGLSMTALADRAETSVSHISRVLNAQRVPSWRTVRAIAAACGHDSKDLRHLWLAARGPKPSTRMPGHGPRDFVAALDALRHALIGLRLAAGEPSLDELEERTARRARGATRRELQLLLEDPIVDPRDPQRPVHQLVPPLGARRRSHHRTGRRARVAAPVVGTAEVRPRHRRAQHLPIRPALRLHHRRTGY